MRHVILTALNKNCWHHISNVQNHEAYIRRKCGEKWEQNSTKDDKRKKEREEHIELSFHLNVSIISVHQKMQTSEFNHLRRK